MSSYVSTINIDDREWRDIQQKVCDTNVYVARKREEANRLREEIRRREQELNELRRQTEKTIDSAVNLLQGGFHKAINNLSADAGAAIRQRSQSVSGEISALRDDIRATAANTAAASSRVTRISQGFTEAVDTLIKQDKDKEKSARLYLDNMSDLLKQIEALNPESFEPRAWFEVQRIVKDAKLLIEDGRYEASLIGSHTGLLKASELLTRLILANESFSGKIVEISAMADALKMRFDLLDPDMDGGIEFEIDGGKYEYEYDINHWSEGRFERLRSMFMIAYEQFREAKEKRAPLAQLEALKRTFEEIGKRLEHCDTVARCELLGSLKAEETAMRLNDALPGNWKLTEQGYDKDDDRQPYKLCYKDASGNSISLVVSPGASAEKPSIYLEAFAEDETQADIIKKDIITTKLPNEGIIIEQSQHLGDCQSHVDGNTFVQNTLPKAAVLNDRRRQKSFGF